MAKKMNISDSYLRYAIPINMAVELEKKGVSISTFRKSTLKNLIEKYDIESTMVDYVWKCIKRKPIKPSIIQDLLENSSFTCCLCKGTKGDGFIIHHIVPYAKTQDNSYGNLAVLCPNDHDLAHREGVFLTNRITEKQIREAKLNWEEEVKKNNIDKSKQSNSELNRIDKSKIAFRVTELADNKAQDFECNHAITTHTKLVLLIDHTSTDQEFVAYVSFKTSENDQKWIGFSTALALKNVYISERVYRVGRPGKKHYEFVEYILERINESGLTFNGEPIIINKIRLWGWHNNNKTINFKFAFLD